MAADGARHSPRVPTGVPGLDALLGGGIPRYRSVLVCGDTGTGKTTLGVQFLMSGIAAGEPGLLVSVDQKPQHIVDDARAFGWDLDAAVRAKLLGVLGASPAFTALRGLDGLDARQVCSDLTQQIRRANATRLVIDGADSLVPDGAAPAAIEDFLRSLVVSLEDNPGCTTILTGRTSEGRHPNRLGAAAERLVSGLIELRSPESGIRSLLIRKMRGAPSPLTPQLFDITANGIVLRPQQP